jgi:hypothetical protein
MARISRTRGSRTLEEERAVKPGAAPLRSPKRTCWSFCWTFSHRGWNASHVNRHQPA